MKKLLLLTFLLFAQPLFACDYNTTFEPQRPTNRDDITIAVGGTCPDACIPQSASFQISGNRITISLSRTGGCILIPVSWGERLNVGRMLAGTYEIVIRFNGETVALRSLVVNSAPFSFAPTYGPGGTRVMIRGLDLGTCTTEPCIPKVRFSGFLSESVSVQDDGTILATAPPHAPGLVDISVEDFSRQLHTVLNGFRYAAHGDPEAEYDRVMFPLNFDGPGAGAFWNTRITIMNDGPVEAFTRPPGDFLRAGGRSGFPTHGEDGGKFLHIARGLEPHFSFNAHIFDRLTASTLGTEMPVVRAGDTAREIRLLGVRVGSGYRTKLRVYDFDATPNRPVLVKIVTLEGTLTTRELTLSSGIVCIVPPCHPPAPTFAVLDLDGITEDGFVDVTVTARTNEARLWAFVSVTNNKTQQVTFWTPQHASARVSQ